MEAYYRERAAVYDEFYQVSRRQDDLVALRSWVVERVQNSTILEVAAGTGYWTEVAAPAAKTITATDCNPETLAIAAQRSLGSHVSLIVADAYQLPEFPDTFSAGMAMLWWSHVHRQRRQEFLSHFASRLAPGALILMFDQFYIEGLSSPISRRDEWNNLYTERVLPNGKTFEIVKNYPTDDEIIETFSDLCEHVEIARLREFWTVSARLRR
ncbi:class I SAM-dependent methyltransferase [Bradyrhizobium sp. HKCCYLS1011]|uniref:class I SAM-dependent methyltransferase n=1 Tax=Bradyrhizobium sp. HKCCYLS1011 TaxID=3420733 RepID=UPI003EB7BFD0